MSSPLTDVQLSLAAAVTLLTMSGCKLWLGLLLALSFCLHIKASGETLVKTIGKEADVTPLCTNGTDRAIVLIVCKISTKRSRGEQCRLVYRYEHGFDHQCDSRFRLMIENQTLFLHLINLTPEDSGSYTCECSQNQATHILHLNITVEEVSGDENVPNPFLPIVLQVTAFIILTGIILGFLCRNNCSIRKNEPITGHPNSEEAEDREAYNFVNRTAKTT
ncbi:uncharacterized protein KZ484_018222 isoform 2-T4 [Pholidichthys leucotaenia]